jgi:hypothetical protein
LRIATASIPSAATGVIHGCYNPLNSYVRVIDTDTGQRCALIEKPLNWNQTGPIGSVGPPGPPGPAGQNVTLHTPDLANCPNGGAQLAVANATADVCTGPTGPAGPTGPVGPPGPFGPPGPAGSFSSAHWVYGPATTVSAGSDNSGYAACPPGETALSGGEFNDSATGVVVVNESYESTGNAQYWYVFVKNNGQFDHSFTVEVLCSP